MSEYPDIQRGTQFGQVPARQWQKAFIDLRRVVGMTAGPGLILDKGFTNYRITRTQPTPATQPAQPRTVVLVEPFDKTSMVLNVREARYQEAPPSDATDILYTWHNDAFQAFPEPGTEPFEYEPFLWTEQIKVTEGDESRIVLKVPQVAETIFLRARYEHGLWIIDLSGSIKADKLVIVHAFGNNGTPGSRFLVVHEVVLTYDAEHVWTGEYEIIGEPVEVNVWHNMKAGNYAPWLWVPTEINREATLLPLTFMLGAWWVKPQPKFAASLRRGPLAIVDCQPTEDPP